MENHHVASLPLSLEHAGLFARGVMSTYCFICGSDISLVIVRTVHVVRRSKSPLSSEPCLDLIRRRLRWPQTLSRALPVTLSQTNHQTESDEAGSRDACGMLHRGV